MWKVERDSYYSELHRKFGLAYIAKAGFFEDTDTVDRQVLNSLDILCTPVAFLKRSAAKPAILLSTGSYCPIHFGHVEMMISARKAVEAAGYNVVGGYFSPSHDEYVKAKTGGGWIPDFARLKKIRDAISHHPWMQIDPWEAVFNKVAINFTDVIDRLKAYVLRHTGIDADIFYVCGGDNAKFALTFALKGHCVVVSRPGYTSQVLKDYAEALRPAMESKRVVLAEGNADVSSSELRQPYRLEKTTLQLRVDECDPGEVRVAEALQGRFSSVKVHYVRKEQSIQFAELPKDNLISLDTIFQARYNLPISRHYDLYGASKLGYGLRPNPRDTRPLKAHIKSIPPGNYGLFDDDIHTGKTMQFVKDLLAPCSVNIDKTYTLTTSSGDGEILDAADFLFGAGLVVQLPNQETVRLPYMYPYVCPYIRGSVLDPKELSLEMWKLNAEIYEKTDLTIGQFRNLQPFANYMGYIPSKPIVDICREHAQLLRLRLCIE